MADESSLTACLEVLRPVVAGLSALALLRIENAGIRPALVSARLNLMEGDVSLTVTDPGGGERLIRGWQADTGLHRVELPPGQSLLGVINLLDTPEGPVFPAPGDYRLRADYTPGPRAPAISAPPIPVTVVPRSGAEEELAALVTDPAVRRGLVLGDRDSAPDKLHEIARRFPGTLEARLAGLIVGDPDPEAADDGDPLATAYAIRALVNPYSRTGERLARAYSDRFASADAGRATQAALRVLKGEPLAD